MNLVWNLSVSDCCWYHDQQKLFVVKSGVHRIMFCVVLVRACVYLHLVGILQVDDYTSLSWLTTRFLPWCNYHCNSLRWLTHVKKKKEKEMGQLMWIHSSSVVLFIHFKVALSQSGNLGNMAPCQPQVRLDGVLLRSSQCWYSSHLGHSSLLWMMMLRWTGLVFSASVLCSWALFPILQLRSSARSLCLTEA